MARDKNKEEKLSHNRLAERSKARRASWRAKAGKLNSSGFQIVRDFQFGRTFRGSGELSEPSGKVGFSARHAGMRAGAKWGQLRASTPRFGAARALSVQCRVIFRNGPRSNISARHARTPPCNAKRHLNVLLSAFLRKTSASSFRQRTPILAGAGHLRSDAGQVRPSSADG